MLEKGVERESRNGPIQDTGTSGEDAITCADPKNELRE